MIKIKCFIASFDYCYDHHVELYFPAVPRIGDFVALPKDKERELARMAISDYGTFNLYQGWLCGLRSDYYLHIDASHVRSVDWWPSEDEQTMECYICLDEEIVNGEFCSERNYDIDFSEEEYLQIKKRTEEHYKL